MDSGFYNKFREQHADNQRFFIDSKNPSHYLFNLPEYAKYRLQLAGISQISQITKDTFANSDEFFSYRRSCKNRESGYGRQISAIIMR